MLRKGGVLVVPTPVIWGGVWEGVAWDTPPVPPDERDEVLRGGVKLTADDVVGVVIAEESEGRGGACCITEAAGVLEAEAGEEWVMVGVEEVGCCECCWLDYSKRINE